MKKIFRRLYSIIADYKSNRAYKPLGVKNAEVRRLKRGSGSKRTTLFGVEIEITNFFWYLHGLNEIFLDKTYQFNSKNDTPVILDCGANIGLSAIFFKKLYPKANVIAFEADKEIAKTLASNLNAFGYNDVEVVAKAVWIENTTLEFKSDGSVGGQIVKDMPDSIKIEAVRLNDFLSSKVDFLKIDVEGVEYDLLKDCAANLINVDNIFIEYHSFLKDEQKLDEILLILKKAGFKYYIKEAWNNMPNPFTDSRKSHYDLQLNIFGYRL